MSLKDYNENIQENVPKTEDPDPSGVACTEKRCKGEMMVQNPKEYHPEIPKLRRAACGVCSWRGWV